MYQICTCPQSNLTGGDPQCPIHGHRPVAVTTSWCESCAAKDARIKELEVGIIKDLDIQAKENTRLDSIIAALVEKIEEIRGECDEWAGKCVDARLKAADQDARRIFAERERDLWRKAHDEAVADAKKWRRDAQGAVGKEG